ncbi:unnamed protein product [Leptidea sinapis]|uniref:CRAL-TRIO domain-containing protein n=1 Tax=Leptidea sinapis TaxID=189913 RepID=A0A5E4QHS0_9NEOP|nr:unnamed protein product [Leptidea sinapis]
MPMDGEEFPLEEEYKKDTGIKKDDIKDLRRWLRTQPHLPEKYITDLDLILAYHACDRSSSVTKDVLDLHYTLKTLFTPYFKDRTLDDSVQQTLKTVLMTTLPMRTKEGYVIFYTHLLNYDAKYFNYGEAVKAVIMVLDASQHEQGTWPGMLLAIDFEGLTLRHMTKIDLQNLQRFLYFLQEAILVKVKGLHFLNAPPFIDKLLMMAKPFLKKELMDMLGFHVTGSKEVENILPIEALPKDFGGSYKTSEECAEDVVNLLRRNEQYFAEDNKKRVTESLRPGKPPALGNMFSGLEGSFKKLDID